MRRSVPLMSTGWVGALLALSLLASAQADETASESAQAKKTMSASAQANKTMSVSASDTDDAGDTTRWSALRAQLFGDRELQTGSGVIALDAPARAFDAARVTVTIEALAAQTPERFIERVWLIVDNNPLPVAGEFEFQPSWGWNTIDTELRVNEYSPMRVVAERSDGSLHMDESFIKAVGGCSAPPSSFERSDATLLGSFRGGVEQLLDPKVPALARIRLVHPNASGMQFDQFTRTYIPAHYVHTIGAELDGETLFTLTTNFSLSQDPVLGFDFEPRDDGELTLYALDSEDRRFEKSWPIRRTASN